MISANKTGNIRNTEARSRNHCCRGKAISIIYSECVSVALVINRTKSMRRVLPLSVACLALTHFSTLSHKRHDIINIKCVFWFSLQQLAEIFLILNRTQRDTIITVKSPSCELPVILVRFWSNLKFRDSFEKQSNVKFQENPSIESRVVPYGRTDRHDDANSRFCKFYECTSKVQILILFNLWFKYKYFSVVK